MCDLGFFCTFASEFKFRRKKMILLSFDTEEFEVPREHGVEISLEEGMKVSVYGTNKILDVLKQNQVHATFFCTGNFAENAPEVIERIKREGHEVACHGVDHWIPRVDDVVGVKCVTVRPLKTFLHLNCVCKSVFRYFRLTLSKCRND